jgi:hypothetical protein
MSRVLSVTAAAAALAVFPGVAVATPARGPVSDPVAIGPHESFVGDVNGAISNGVIQMGCFGPVRPGEMGHPLAGQSSEVQGPDLDRAADAVLRQWRREVHPDQRGSARAALTREHGR